LHWGLYQTKEPQAIGECHRALTALVADGAFRPLVSERLGLEELPDVLHRLAHSDTVGRVSSLPDLSTAAASWSTRTGSDGGDLAPFAGLYTKYSFWPKRLIDPLPVR
jgi:hypothetical protein